MLDKLDDLYKSYVEAYRYAELSRTNRLISEQEFEEILEDCFLKRVRLIDFLKDRI